MNDAPATRVTRREAGFTLAKKASTLRRDWQAPQDYTIGSKKSRKGTRSKQLAMISSMHSDLDDGTVEGVAYSFDAYSGPSHGADVFGFLVEQAEVKYDNKVFDTLVKTEYEMIETTSEEDSDEEFELIDM